MKRKMMVFTLLSIIAISQVQITSNAQIIIETPPEISLRAAIIEWRYKIIDGWLYKRQYNYSTSEWVGNWIKC
jgi:hypothetical protein